MCSRLLQPLGIADSEETEAVAAVAAWALSQTLLRHSQKDLILHSTVYWKGLWLSATVMLAMQGLTNANICKS